MNQSAILHRSTSPDCYALDTDTAVIRIRTGKDVLAVTLIHEDPYAFGIAGDIHWKGQRLSMTVRFELKNALIWEARVQPRYKRLQYYFEVTDGTETLLVLEDDLYTPKELETPGLWKQYYKFPWMNPSDVFRVPEWVERTLWYQIMPDRFCRGSEAPKRMPLKPWDEGNKVGFRDYYGGDLKGILQKLPYLKQLGITGIYLLPIFRSDSNHKYDTIDYLQIDPDFGTEEELRELVQTAHSMGIRVMLDAVFNHSGFRFGPWQDVWEKGKASPYFDWFCINEPDFSRKRGILTDGRYYGFAFIDGMPKLNTNHPQAAAYLRDLCIHWVRDWDIDGIRFDVGNEIAHTFLKSLRLALKPLKPDLFLLGEIWHDSLPWLLGDEYDSVMNYPFFESLHRFWAEPDWDARQLMYAMNRVYSLYPEQVNRVIFNFLDTHDTLRARNRCGSLDVLYQQLAVLMTMPGSRCIYYGTEVAMAGGHDPDCRRTMPWSRIEAGKLDAPMEEMRKLLAVGAACNPHSDAVEWHPDPAHPRLVTYDRPGVLRVRLNGGIDPVELDADGEILYSRCWQKGRLAPGGILITKQ